MAMIGMRWVLAAGLAASLVAPALWAGRCGMGKVAAAVLRRQPAPPCPAVPVRCAGQVVTLEVRIAGNGRAVSARQLEGHPWLGRAAVDTVVGRWRWDPAWINGEPVEVTQVIRVRYAGW